MDERGWRVRLIALTGMLLLAACSQEPPASNASMSEPKQAQTAGDPVSEAAAGPILARVKGAKEGDAAAFLGALLIEGQCVFVKNDAQRLLLVAANPDIALSPDGTALVDGPRSFRSGDRVMVGGSSTTMSKLKTLWTHQPPETCTAESGWLAVSIERQR